MKIYLLTSLIIAFAGFTQGLSGFGSVIITLPLLALFLNIKTVIPLAGLLSLCISLILTVQLRHHLKRAAMLPLLIASVPGIPLGVYMLKTVDSRILELLAGGILVLYSAWRFRGMKAEPSLKACWAYLAGFSAGCLGGSTGANGPPVIIYASLQPWNKDEIKSTLAGYFFITGIGISALHGLNGLITREVLNLSLIALPSLLLGVLAGSLCYRKVDTVSYRKAPTVMLLILGLIMLFKAVDLSAFRSLLS